MKAIVAALATLTRRFPLVVVLVSLAIAIFLGSFAGQVEVATGNEGFAPESPEIAAQERISELFGDESSTTAVQVLVRRPDGDVITVEGLLAAMKTAETIRQAEIGSNVADTPEQPGLIHYLSSVEQAAVMLGIAPDQLTDQQVKDLYIEAIDADGENDAPPEQVGFLTRLVSEDFDPTTVSASAGMVLAFVNAPEGADVEESFNRQVEIEVAMAEDLESVETNLEIRPFSFGILISGADDFTDEVGQLFGLALVVILIILLFVYWLSPRATGSWARSVRRTVADTLVTLLTIVLAIISMQGVGFLLEQIGVINAFSAPTQIVPILLIGLGVDYGIHLTSRYREEIGGGESVESGIVGAINGVGVALVLATVTTVIGFLTNVFNPVPALSDFGILAAVGIVIAFLLMLTFVPALRLLLDRRAEANGTLPAAAMESHGDRVLPRIMEKAAVLAEKAAVPTLIVALALGGVGLWGFLNLETSFSFTDFLPSDSPHVETLDILVEDFGGGLGESTAVLVEAEDGDVIDGGVHNALVRANSSLVDVEDVDVFETPQGPFVNANSALGLLGQLLAGGPESAPPELSAAAQQVGLKPDLTVEPSADVTPLYQAILDLQPEAGAGVIHMNEEGVDALRWDITTTAGESVTDLRMGLADAFQPVRDSSASAIATSDNIIGDVVVTGLTESQTNSLLITVAAAAAVLILSFAIETGRPFLGVLTIAPVALVVLWTYAMMHIAGIPLGPVTATLAALAVGIGVPFTIHIARRFLEDRKTYSDLDAALRSTTRHTGGALAGSAFTTMAGFGVLIRSSLTPFQQMGQVTVFAIGFSLIAAVLVLPSLLALWDRYHQKRGTSLNGG